MRRIYVLPVTVTDCLVYAEGTQNVLASVHAPDLESALRQAEKQLNCTADLRTGSSNMTESNCLFFRRFDGY